MKTTTLPGYWTIQVDGSSDCFGEYKSKSSANREIRRNGGTAVFVPEISVDVCGQKGAAWS